MPSLGDIVSGIADGLGWIGNGLDTYSGASSVRDLIAGENPWDQWLDPQNQEKRVTGRQMLEKSGLVGENTDQGWVPDLGDIGGFAAEALLDPTNLLGGAGLAKRLMGISKTKAVNRGIEAANTLSREQRAMGFMPEEVAKLTKIVDETGQPKRMYHGTPNGWEGNPDPTKWIEDPAHGKGHYTTDAKGDIPSGYAGVDSKVPDEDIPWLKEQLLSRGRNPAVKIQFIDARNPLDLDTHYRFGDLPEPIQKQIVLNEREKLRGSIDDYKRTKDDVDPYWKDWHADDIAYHFPIRNGPPTVKGQELLGIVKGELGPSQELLQSSGYDAITHRGGAITGGAPHNVVIALDPKNVYLPYIAKELQDLQHVASPNSLLASLAGYNALAHSKLGDNN